MVASDLFVSHGNSELMHVQSIHGNNELMHSDVAQVPRHSRLTFTCVGARRLEKTFSATYFINDARHLVQDTLDRCTGTCKLMKSLGVSAPPPQPVHTSSIIERVQMDLLQMYGPKSPL